jgi:hypothetical protein
MADEGEPRQAPAGWYEDPQGGGGRRYWDGTRWTERRQLGRASPAGWYEDPRGGGGRRYWDGGRWTEQTQPAEKSSAAAEQPGPAAGGGPSQPTGKPPGGLKGFYRKHTVWSWVIIGLVGLTLLIVIGALIPAEEDGDGGGSGEQAAEEQPNEQPEEQTAEEQAAEEQTAEEEEPEPQEPAPSPEQRVRDALGDTVSSDLAVGESDVRSVNVSGRLLSMTLTTPEGGFEGASTDDTDALASAALSKAYEDGGGRGPAFVEFRGGLVDSATGRELPNARTVSYRIDRGRAKQIDWSDDEVLFAIDWGLYRLFCHPAIKGW